jgi:hypothetical protein
MPQDNKPHVYRTASGELQIQFAPIFGIDQTVDWRYISNIFKDNQINSQLR